MSKKIYDILPPKLAHKVEDTLKAMVGDNKNKKSRKKANSIRKKRRFPFKEILIGSGVIFALLAIYFYSKLPRADIQIWPKTDILTFKEKITADKSINEVDLLQKTIPAQYIEVEKESQQEFLATGIASNDGKASGTIKVYNKINPSTPLTLKVGTHFLSDSGKYFVTLQKITIPATKNNLPGSINVSVQAEEPGAHYNIGPSKFSVPKLSGTSYYYSIWAESESKMAGGYTGQVKKVTKDDIQQAKDVLTKKLLSQAEDSLRSKLSPEDVLLDGAILRNVIDTSSSVKEGETSDKFDEKAKVKVLALVFKKQDLEKFAKNDIVSQLPNSRKFLEKSLNINYNPDSIDMKSGLETINLQLSVKTYYDIDVNNLIDLFSLKSADQIKEVFNEEYGDNVAELKVNFWPFWVKSAPSNKSRVKVNLNFQ